jgi:hypothetical protein
MMVPKVLWVLKVTLDPRVIKVIEVIKVLLVLQVPRAGLVLKDRKAIKAIKVTLAQL